MAEQEDSIHRSTGYWASRLARTMERDFEERLRPLGITRGAFAVLSAIHNDKRNRPAELATFMGLNAAAITRYLDQVEALGLIERAPNPNDRRSTHVELTAEGRSTLHRGVRASRATNGKFTAKMTTAEIADLETTIRRMLELSDTPITGL